MATTTINQCSLDDELTQTFEIIDEKECMDSATPSPSSAEITPAIRMTTSLPIIDSLNNNNKSSSDASSFTLIDGDINDDSNNNNNNNNVSNNNNNNIVDSKKPSNMKYSRDQLIQMKQIASTIIPNLKKEVKNYIFTETSELDNTLTRKFRNDATMPSFMNSNTPNRPKQQRSNDGGRRSQQGNRGNQGSMITLRLQSNEDVVLKEAENAWKPQTLLAPAGVVVDDIPEDEKKTAELLKQFRSILNKLTPENFSKLMEKLKILKIDTVDRLDNCISLVFEKAITESNYASSYALLCKEVSDVFIVPLDPNNPSNEQQKAVFKKRLITQCQREFEKSRDNKLFKNTQARLKEIEEETDPVKKEEMKAEFDFESTKLRKRAVGTVHFIGELYKIEMLTSKIMRSCIQHLLDPSICSEETLECLCKLLNTVGKRLEKLDKNKIDLSDYFVNLEKLADKNNPINISSRIRFMIQDVIECRLNNWTPRKLQRENKPLTMDEIKQKVILEQALKDMDNKDAMREEKASGGGNRNRRTGAVNEDGWSTQYAKPRPVKFDSLKLPIANDDIKLGQPSNFQNFQNYQNNRFAGLKEEENMEQSNRSNMSNNNNSYNGRFSGNSSYDGGNRNIRGGGGGGRRLSSKSLQGGNNQKFVSSRNANHNNHSNYESRQHRQSMQFFSRPNDLPIKSSTLPTRKTSAPARPMQYSEAFIQERNLINDPNKVINILKTSLTGYQHKEITMEEIIEKLRKFRVTKDSLVLLYNWAFDQHDNERLNLTEIICECVSRQVIMMRDLLDAFKETIELAQDLACDLPLVYNYIGQLLALPIVKRMVHFKDLLEISKPLQNNTSDENNNAEKVLKNIFKIIEQQHSKDVLSQLYNDANINFQLFLESESTSLEEFMKENVRNLNNSNNL